MYFKKPRIENRELLNTYHQRRCCVCNTLGCDPCHIKTRGAGGDDVEWNLLAMCRKHHTEQGQIGFIKMFALYPWLERVMHEKGWRVQQDGQRKRIVNVLFK